MFANAKAQAWWALRDRFLEAFKASKGEAYDRDAIISLIPAIEELRELKSGLSRITYTYNPAGKVVANKAPDGHSSPNRADSVMIAFAPVSRGISLIGIFGGDGSVWEPDPKIWG
jgi:phage terminase large subunit